MSEVDMYNLFMQALEEMGYTLPARRDLVELTKTLVAAELRSIRKVYEDMELEHDTAMEDNRKYATWRRWKMVRNVITDRIEELTGNRM